MKSNIVSLLVIILTIFACEHSKHGPPNKYECEGNYQDSFDICQEYDSVRSDLVILGDSIMPPHVTCQGVPGQLSRILDEKVNSIAVGGAVLSQIISQYYAAMSVFPDIETVIFDGGANDILIGGDPFEVAVKFSVFIDLIISNGHRPIVVCIYNPVGEWTPQVVPLSWYTDLQLFVCADKGIDCIDLRGPFDEHPCPMAVDGLHPNPEGHRIIAELIEELL